MNTKTTNTAASAKSGKAAAAKGRKQSRLANVGSNAISARASLAGAGSKKAKKPFVL